MKVHSWNQMRMEHDGTDSTDAETLNGDTKPDPAKLAQNAIIKQDVMLSATSTQSPLAASSSVFTMPSVSMAASAGQTAIASLHDTLFMTVPSVNDATMISHINDLKQDAVANSGLSALSSPAAHQLFGQPQVATPQFFLASQPGMQAAQPMATVLAGGIGSGANAATIATLSGGTSTSIPVQQLLIPVSTANGSQQFISIPVSLATGGNQQIQLLTTSNGQLIATNLASIQGLATPINMSIPQTASPVSSSSGSQQMHTTAPQHNAAQALQPQAAHQSNNVQSSNSAAAAAASVAQNLSTAISANQIAGLPSLLTGSVGQTGQLLTVAPQVLGSAASSVSQTQSCTNNNNSSSSNTSVSSTTNHLNTTNHSVAHQHQPNASQQQQLTMSPQPAHRHTPSLNNHQLASAVTVTQAGSTTSSHAPSSAAAAAAALQQQLSQVMQAQGLSASAVITAMSHPTVRAATIAPQVVTTTDGLPAAVSQLLPNTVSNSTESTTVDGINLDEIKEFAKQFKIRRLSLGLTQTQVGQALSATEGPAYSQSAICRFEKLDITPKSAQKIKPVLERWMIEAEDRYKNGVQHLSDFIGSEPSKKRKRRTSFTPQALELLNVYFERNTHPSGAEMTEMSEKLNYGREVIRVWFCNKRQALKNTIKRLKQPDGQRTGLSSIAW